MTQSENLATRRDLGGLISDMRITECESRGIPRLCSASQANRKSNDFWGQLGAPVDVTDALTTRQRVPLL